MVNKEPEMLQKRSHFLNSVHETMQVNSSVSTEQLFGPKHHDTALLMGKYLIHCSQNFSDQIIQSSWICRKRKWKFSLLHDKRGALRQPGDFW